MAKKKGKILKTLALWLITIGALNWGLERIFNFNLVDTIVGAGSVLSQWIYGLVGLAGAYAVYLLLVKQLK